MIWGKPVALAPVKLLYGHGHSPAVAAIASRPASGMTVAGTADTAGRIDGSRIRRKIHSGQDHISAATAAARTCTVSSGVRAIAAAHVNRAREVDRVADENDRRSALSTLGATRTTLTAHCTATRPRAAVAHEHSVLSGRGRQRGAACSSASRAAETSIHDWYAGYDLRRLTRYSGRSSAAATSATPAEVALARDSGSPAARAAHYGSRNRAGARRPYNQRAVASSIDHGRT